MSAPSEVLQYVQALKWPAVVGVNIMKRTAR
jgi:hypothetical protein